MNSITRSYRSLAVALCGSIVWLALVARAPSDTIAGYECVEINGDDRDAMGLVDSCLGPSSQGACSYVWCEVDIVDDGWYCRGCEGSCSCSYGLDVEAHAKDGFCQWGHGNEYNPRPDGECFCYYNEQTAWVPGSIHECSS